MIEIPGYTIQRELGFGGMATVYLAMQDSLQRAVALKVMAPVLAADRTFSERFQREARTIAQLSHQHIVAVYDIGVIEHHHYIAMEYINNGDLKSRIVQQMAIETPEVKRILLDIAQALSYAHERGFVHRDVKPENILFRMDGTSVLTDFGIAKATGGGIRMTGAGMSIGTPHYMSPEQARGKEVDGRADFYSLGVMLYEMLTGTVPFDAEDSLAIGIKHISEPVPKLPESKKHFQLIIDRLMAKNPSDRVQNAAELTDLLDNLKSGQDNRNNTRSVTPKTVNRAEKTQNMSEWRLALSGGMVAVLLAVGLLYFKGLQKPEITEGRGTSKSLPQQAKFPKIRRIEIQKKELISTKKKAPLVTNNTSSNDEKGMQNILPSVAVDSKNIKLTNPQYDNASQKYRRDFELELSKKKEVPIVDNTSSNDEKEIQNLLQSAEVNLESFQLTSPAHDNALQKYRRVLKLEPNNYEGKKGMKNIVNRYLDLADKNIKKQLIHKAKFYINMAESIGPKMERVSQTQAKWEAMYSSRGNNFKKPLKVEHKSNVGQQKKNVVSNMKKSKFSMEIGNFYFHYRNHDYVKAYAQIGKIVSQYSACVFPGNIDMVKKDLIKKLGRGGTVNDKGLPKLQVIKSCLSIKS